MNTIYESIFSHRSIRKYKNQKIPEEVLDRILEAGTRASSSGNMQPYSIIVTTDISLKQELFPLHFEQSMVLDAPVLITFCADFNRMRKWLALNDAPENFDNMMSFLIGMIDATLVSQNVALAAEAEGLGICYMGTTLASNKDISRVLKLPKHVVPVVGFSLGYPDESPALRDRLPLKAIVHANTYQDYTSKDILEHYKEKEVSGMKRYKSDPELKKMIEQYQAENLAQVYTKVKYTKESHQKYSKDVLECLFEQGFTN
ncbi:MAG: NADPH-dependent oxidoreductase [Bdellovibrionales bacterium CG12_big_fil_rev_8_21_14_0_65_38_15]|nr:MAG: NADPH-dependent oxidoreductase [Bdellovibrionales bacterium CG22_combo_CG10-13_8_21_14_all_38_13]PIQ52344.1 MAG: NADPH-dependent oxidoreductase [Bdellovibrionales bacterium CG12_big_fil_rev_8_21_14_0_65_38_15]PIR30429.1 MAG: NADPH-dependent oxidoreductase [Bdellovibrionales bacterium CG11_big_fil_rev_8_21_14_0_20_38_13]